MTYTWPSTARDVWLTDGLLDVVFFKAIFFTLSENKHKKEIKSQ